MKIVKNCFVVFCLLYLATGLAIAQGSIRLDIKTELNEKTDSAPIIIGAVRLLNESQNFKVVEFGEDYSVWLVDNESYIEDDEIFVQLNVELRNTSFIGKGHLINREMIEFNYSRNQFDIFSEDEK